MALNKAPKKVNARVKAIVRSVGAGTKLGTTTELALSFLKERPRTRAELIKYYEDGKANKRKSYTKGTASAQANSILGAFSLLKVIEEADDNAIAINKDSTILPKLVF